jgi:hypothetical protein
MSRTRLSTTVDADLLDSARQVRAGLNDARLIDEALDALLARHRAFELDASYAAYDAHPLDEPDEWGDLASFRRAPRRSERSPAKSCSSRPTIPFRAVRR